MHAFKLFQRRHVNILRSRFFKLSCSPLALFNVTDAISRCHTFDKYLQTIEDDFLEYSLLQSTFRNIQDPSVDPHVKILFWPKFISSAADLNKGKMVDSLILFVLQNTNDHSDGTLVVVLKVLASKHRFDEFESLYALIQSRLSPPDRIAWASDLVIALAETPFYMEALSLLLPVRKRSSGVGIFAKVFVGAATYGSFDDILYLLDKLLPLGLHLEEQFYRAFISRFSDSSEHAGDRIGSLLNKLEEHDQWLSSSIALDFKDLFEKRGWHGAMGVSLSGLRCPSCNAYLRKLNINEELCSQLAVQFYNSVIKGANVDELYLTTTPKELDTFHNFLDSQKRPFDCIVDLPNYLHFVTSRRLNSTTSNEQTDHLCNLLMNLHKTYNVNCICLVGKQRGLVGRKLFWEPIKKLGNETGIKIQTFLTDHKSNDDAFMIYMALWSGPRCYLFSKDEFRQHRFTMGSELSANLSRWQAARQISLRSAQSISFLGPVECDPRVQGDMTAGWHIPYESGSGRLSYHPPNTWLCLRPPIP